MVRAVATTVALALAGTASAAPARRAGPAAPLEVTQAFFQALHAGDVGRAARLAEGNARPAIAAMVRSAKAHRELEAAVAKRFGRDEAARVGYGNRVQSEVKALLGAQEIVQGDEAEVVTLDGRTMATLKRVKSAWKVELDDDALTKDGQARLAREADATVAAARAVVPAIRAGRYRDAPAALRDFRARVAAKLGVPPPPDVDDEGGEEGGDDGGVDL
jgi:hypothetical protein